MSTITLPNIRVSSDLTVRLRLKDGGVALDWTSLSNVKAHIYSDAQRSLSGRCSVSVDGSDSTVLICQYAANKPQYLGINRIIVQCTYMGETKTYDKKAFTFVRRTWEVSGEQITIDDPDVDVEIEVQDVSSSILQEAVDAAFSAADRANEAAEAAEHMVDIHTGPEGKSAYEVAVEEGYTGTEEEWLASLVGPQGAQGIQGETGEAAGFGTVSVSLQEDGGQPSATVAASGTDTAKNFAFTFNNLKGEKGDKGEQGNTGSSVDYPFELVNNLTTDDATKGLSAAQGVVLDGKISQLRQEVDDLVADSPADLDLADEDGNVVARFEGGNIKTKNFDSSETTKTANGAAGDLDICDESGNIVARFKDGNIKTKNFDSSRFQQADDICDFIENSLHTGRFKFDRVTIWDYYAAYDELCDFRQILVKESPIGFSTLPSDDRATKDANQYPINLYRIPNASARKRIVFMGAIHGDSQFTDANPTGENWYGDHGDAQENILAPYYFVCDLIRHKDDNPEYKLLLQEYEIDIIPILNPWGVQNHSRRNGNNVDLNRNFDATDSNGNSRWQNQTQGNKGASPFSENETQAIVSYINAHNDIHLVVECHARGEVNLGGDNRFYAVCPDGVPIQQGITDAVNAAKAKFGAQGGLHPYTRDEVPATCYAWIYFEKGIPTFEPELGQSIGRRFFFNVKMSTAKRLNINDVYTITTTVPDFVVTFRVVASDGSDEAMVLGDTYALLYNGTYRCGNDTITIASNTVVDAPSRHCKELLYSMFWYYRKLVFNTL